MGKRWQMFARAPIRRPPDTVSMETTDALYKTPVDYGIDSYQWSAKLEGGHHVNIKDEPKPPARIGFGSEGANPRG